MLLFKRILNPKKAAETPADNRKAKRYAVGPAFPFKAVLTLSHDEDGNPVIENTPRDPSLGSGRLTDLTWKRAQISI